MNENLAQMLKEEVLSNTVSPINLDGVEVEPTISASPDENITIKIKPFSEWFEQYNTRFDNINQVKVAIRGVDPDTTIIVTIPDPKNEKDEDDNLKRKVRIFEDADQIPVIDMAPNSMDIYNNGFRVVYDVSDDIAIKSYGVKTGLIVTLCHKIGDHTIPYEIVKVKKKVKEIEIKTEDVSDSTSKLIQPADKENIQILYKQITKFINNITTNQNAVEWFLSRQNEVMDVNHHLQIDEVICYILK